MTMHYEMKGKTRLLMRPSANYIVFAFVQPPYF